MRRVVALIENILVWVLAVGATARLTRLLTVDELPLVARPRDKIIDRYGTDHWLSYLVTCPWCLGMWVAAAVFPAAFLAGDSLWFQVPAGILTLAMAASAVVVKTD